MMKKHRKKIVKHTKRRRKGGTSTLTPERAKNIRQKLHIMESNVDFLKLHCHLHTADDIRRLHLLKASIEDMIRTFQKAASGKQEA